MKSHLLKNPLALVVDDDAMMRLLARETLEQAGFIVSEAGCGEDALEMLRAQDPHVQTLILLDVEMSGIDGFECCHKIRAIADAATLPIIMVTGHDDGQSVARAYAAGATDFVTKPINWPILGHRALYVLRGAQTLHQLRESEQRTAAMLAAIPDTIVRLGPHDTVIDYKPSSDAGFVAFAGQNLLGLSLDAIFPAPVANNLAHAAHQTLRSGATQVLFHPVETQERRYHCETRVARMGQNEVIALIRDITAQEMAESHKNEALAVFTASNQGICTTDCDGTVTAINPAFTEITGYKVSEVVGKPSAFFATAKQNSTLYDAMQAALAHNNVWEGELWDRRQSGETYPQWLTVLAIRNSDGLVLKFVLLFMDITVRKQHEQDMWHQANHDPLTGLANRSLLHDRLERALAHARRDGGKAGVVFIDLDGFKLINDTLGHASGDKLLIDVAHRLQTSVREQDTVARLGGDEFCLVIHGLNNVNDLQGIAEKVVALLARPYTLSNSQYYLSGSVGVTIFPDDGDDVGVLLKNADMAMYQAKQAGKNRFRFFSDNMQMVVQQRAELAHDLRLAVEQNAFVLHYQPIVAAESGVLVGAEALIRWQHPKRGLVSPLEFIPVAEDCGLMVRIGEWVLRQAAYQWREWKNQGHAPLRMAVNVSAVQFGDGGLPILVEKVRKEYAIPPGALVLEITESLLMDGSRAAENHMREIKAQGVAYALDDFGTGYSSLAYLRRFPIDTLKIDRSFVHQSIENRKDAYLVEAIINMAHSINLQVIAEGVETEAQLELLRELGCDYLQGFLLGKPVAAEQFEQHLLQARLWPRNEQPLDNSHKSNHKAPQWCWTTFSTENWLCQLLGEHAPELTAFGQRQETVRYGLSLRQAIDTHRQCNQRLFELVTAAAGGVRASIEDPPGPDPCQLMAWINKHRTQSNLQLTHLAQAHRQFCALSNRVIALFNRGHRTDALRMFSSPRFQGAARDVITALIDFYEG
ncbi:MAG: EAL domain-containing protein [Rhodoferax sp.]|nr:EAL domain-containing protein [Rhodoferax sp.]